MPLDTSNDERLSWGKSQFGTMSVGPLDENHFSNGGATTGAQSQLGRTSGTLPAILDSGYHEEHGSVQLQLGKIPTILLDKSDFSSFCRSLEEVSRAQLQLMRIPGRPPDTTSRNTLSPAALAHCSFPTPI